MVLNTNTAHRAYCSCGIKWTSSRLSNLADIMSQHTARNHSCVAELVEP